MNVLSERRLDGGTSCRRLDGGVLERHITLDDVPGIVWTPPEAESVPLILMGHPGGGLDRIHPRLVGRAQHSAALGFASAALELPGSGVRPGVPELDAARTELQRAIRAGEAVSDDVVDRLILPLLDLAVPELRSLIDELLQWPEIGGPVAVSGGVIALGVRLATTDPRIVAAGLFAGSYVPRRILEEARSLTIPVHVLLQWDDEGNDRQMALDLFDAFGSQEKTLLANLGGHTGVPAHAGEDAARFFARHLTPGHPAPEAVT